MTHAESLVIPKPSTESPVYKDPFLVPGKMEQAHGTPSLPANAERTEKPRTLKSSAEQADWARRPDSISAEPGEEQAFLPLRPPPPPRGPRPERKGSAAGLGGEVKPQVSGWRATKTSPRARESSDEVTAR